MKITSDIMRLFQCCSYSLACVAHYRDKVNNEKKRKLFSMVMLPAGLSKYAWKSVCTHFSKYHKDKLLVVTIIKNEDEYLSEYCSYYRNIGADILLYDNDSDISALRSAGGYQGETYSWN